MYNAYSLRCDFPFWVTLRNSCGSALHYIFIPLQLQKQAICTKYRGEDYGVRYTNLLTVEVQILGRGDENGNHEGNSYEMSQHVMHFPLGGFPTKLAMIIKSLLMTTQWYATLSTA